ncbi:MAG: aspartate carbamoyltransferase regulatory subunit [Patescibacteria group bacterium]|nr:aspartate carbamoyltransferase regulatory subunit [Patescibacteria group bacterium]
MKNLISIDQFSAREIFEKIIPGCIRMIPGARKAQSGRYKLPDFRERKLTIFSVEPSTRTIDSYMEASGLLGWSDHRTPPPDNTSLMKNESWAETARTWAIQGAGVIAMRTKIEGVQKFLAEILERDGFNVSIQNCGDGEHEHPSQTFLDLVTIKQEKGRLKNLVIGFLGDLRFGRTVHSLVKALSLAPNISLRLVSTREMTLPEYYLKNFKGEVRCGEEMELLADCDVIYATRIQAERFPSEVQYAIEKAKAKYRLDEEALSLFKADAIVMHPLPHANGISPKAILDKRVVVHKQSWYGIPTRMYLLNRGYANRFKKESLGRVFQGKLKIVREENLKDYLKKRRKKKNHTRFGRIDNGTVIDHLPLDFGAKIRNILEKSGFLNEKSATQTNEDVPSTSMGRKDVLVLENVFLTNEMMISIASFAPGSTFNVIGKGRFRKLVLDKTGSIEEIGKCPNMNCITNHDPEAFTKFIPLGGGNIECHYCERKFKNSEII